MMELTAGDAAISVDPACGGRLASLNILGHELLVPRREDPLLWGCYPMAPWTGRIRHGRFTHGGRDHQLGLSMPPHAIHGTVWNRSWERTGDNTLQSSLGEGWPYAGHVEQCLTLEPDRLRLELTLYTDAISFPASIGWHPWFLRDLGTGRSAELVFEAESLYEVDAQQIPTGRLQPASPGPWDDCFTGVRRDPLIRWPGFLELTLSSSLDHWVVYDQPRHALCVEPMSGPPDALNLTPVLVSAGEPLRGSFTLSWRTI